MAIENLLEHAKKNLDRRKFLRASGIAGIGVAATTLIGGGATALAAQRFAPKPNSSTVQDPVTHDTPAEIFTAALIAEDLASTFYYNGLVGAVLQDPALAGPGGNDHTCSQWRSRQREVPASRFIRRDHPRQSFPQPVGDFGGWE